jgi:hypothetical protein
LYIHSCAAAKDELELIKEQIKLRWFSRINGNGLIEPIPAAVVAGADDR